MAYSPQTGYFYALGNASLQWFRRAEDPYFFILGASRVPGMPPGHGVMAAIDGRTGKDRVETGFTGPRPSGALATASGLLFQTMPDGNLIASDAQTGQQIWQFQTGANGRRPRRCSYELDGEQYIAVGMRNNVMAFKLNGPHRGEAAARGRTAAGARRSSPARSRTPTGLKSPATCATARRAVRGCHATIRVHVYRARVKAGTPVDG